MKPIVSPKNRKLLMAAGIPRQTIFQWNRGILPGIASRLAYKQITGEEYPMRKAKRIAGL